MRADETQQDAAGQLDEVTPKGGENEDQSRQKRERFSLRRKASLEVGNNTLHLHRPNALPIVGAYGLGSGMVG